MSSQRLSMRKEWLRMICCGIAWWGLGGLIPTNAAADESRAAADADKQAAEFVTTIARQVIPDKYEDLRDWNQKKEIVSGLRVRLDGLRIRTKRRRKEVNHGTWKMYRLSMDDPGKDFTFAVAQLRPIAPGKLGLHLVCDARLKTHGRLQQWQRGVRLLSVSADGHARVRLTVDCEVAAKLDAGKLPPDVVLHPQVTKARLELMEFRLHRVSDVGGEVAQQLGKALKHILEDQIEKKEHKLIAKMNRQIEKRKDRLRLSLADYLSSKWDKHFGAINDTEKED